MSQPPETSQGEAELGYQGVAGAIRELVRKHFKWFGLEVAISHPQCHAIGEAGIDTAAKLVGEARAFELEDGYIFEYRLSMPITDPGEQVRVDWSQTERSVIDGVAHECKSVVGHLDWVAPIDINVILSEADVSLDPQAGDGLHLGAQRGSYQVASVVGNTSGAEDVVPVCASIGANIEAFGFCWTADCDQGCQCGPKKSGHFVPLDENEKKAMASSPPQRLLTTEKGN